MNQTFKGHGILAMVANVVLAIWPPVALIAFENHIRPVNTIGTVICGLYFLIMFPHPTYLFFEIKHLLFKDGVADDPDSTAIMVFGGLSLLGLAIQVLTNVLLIQLLPAQLPRIYMTLILSFLASFGTCLGLTDLVSLHIFWPPLVVEHLIKVLRSRELIGICFFTTVLLSLLTLLFT